MTWRGTSGFGRASVARIYSIWKSLHVRWRWDSIQFQGTSHIYITSAASSFRSFPWWGNWAHYWWRCNGKVNINIAHEILLIFHQPRRSRPSRPKPRYKHNRDQDLMSFSEERPLKRPCLIDNEDDDMSWLKREITSLRGDVTRMRGEIVCIERSIGKLLSKWALSGLKICPTKYKQLSIFFIIFLCPCNIYISEKLRYKYLLL